MQTNLDILILEDSGDDRFLLERALGKAGIGFHSTWVGSRDGFIQALESTRPGVIIADCRLPDIEAREALEIATRLQPGVPVVLVTGGLSDDEAASLLHSGAQDYVLKDRLARIGPAVLVAVERAGTEARRRQDALRLKEALLGTIMAVTRTVELRDPYTAGHQARVAALAVAIGREMGMPEDRLEGIRLGAQIHDIGKVRVPAEILTRPGNLTRAEFDVIRAHPEAGREIVKDIEFPWPVAQMVVQHHERLDGTGYPFGLRGAEIIPEARIIAVADVVEAMTAHRPYRAGLSLEAALGEIGSGRGTFYDPGVVDACVRVSARDPLLCGGAAARRAA